MLLPIIVSQKTTQRVRHLHRGLDWREDSEGNLNGPDGGRFNCVIDLSAHCKMDRGHHWVPVIRLQAPSFKLQAVMRSLSGFRHLQPFTVWILARLNQLFNLNVAIHFIQVNRVLQSKTISHLPAAWTWNSTLLLISESADRWYYYQYCTTICVEPVLWPRFNRQRWNTASPSDRYMHWTLGLQLTPDIKLKLQLQSSSNLYASLYYKAARNPTSSISFRKRRTSFHLWNTTIFELVTPAWGYALRVLNYKIPGNWVGDGGYEN